MSKGKWVVGTDVGGTFTDIIGINLDTGEQKLGKVSTTPPTYYEGIINGLKRADLKGEETHSFRHGATVSTNAVEERKGVNTAADCQRSVKLTHLGRNKDFKLTHLESGRKAANSPEWRRICGLYGEQTQGARTRSDIELGQAGLGHPAHSAGAPAQPQYRSRIPAQCGDVPGGDHSCFCGGGLGSN